MSSPSASSGNQAEPRSVHPGSQSHRAILAAAKECFARKGVEASTLADVSQAARVSEAELQETYGYKYKLLIAILDEAWAAINPRIAETIAKSSDPRHAMISILSTAANVMQKDPALVRLMLLEAYRPDPRTNRVMVSRGYQAFVEMATKVAEQGQQRGFFKTNYHPRVIVSLVVAVAQGVLRDALLAQERGETDLYTTSQLMTAFEAIVASLRP